MRRTTWFVLLGMVVLLGALLAGGILWSRSLSARIAAERTRVAELGVPLSVEGLQASYLETLGPERSAPLAIDELVARATALRNSDWPDGPLDPGAEETPNEAQLEYLGRHRDLLEAAREALREPGRRVPFPLDPLGTDHAYQVGLRGLLQLAMWDAERLELEGAAVDEVVTAWAGVLDLVEVLAAIPNTLAQMERVMHARQVATRIRATLLRAPDRAVALLDRLGAGPVEDAALRATYPQAVLIARVEELFEQGAAPTGGAGGVLPDGDGWLAWLWLRRGVPHLYAHVAEVIPLLRSRDLPGVQAVDERVRQTADDKGELFGLLVFQAGHLLAAEEEQHAVWAVTSAGAEALEHRQRTGGWPAARPAAAGVPGYRIEPAELEVWLGEQSWRIPESR